MTRVKRIFEHFSLGLFFAWLSLVYPSPGHAASKWDSACYRGYEADVMAVVGVAATDCGILPRDADAFKSKKLKQCLAKMLESDQPFRVAHASDGDDSMFCDAVARDSQGTFWSIYYDSDVTGQMGSDGGNAALWISQCARIEQRPGTIGPGSFFDAIDCKEDKATLDRVIAARKKP